jgi:uncharacterized protein (DUF58 family)
MKWYLGAIVLLLAALAFGLGLMAYAMYALLGVMVVSRFLARSWAESLDAQRECNRFTANVGDAVAVILKVKNRGALPVAWVLLEDLLPREAMAGPMPRLEVLGSCLQLAMLGPRGQKTILYQLRCRGRGYFQIGPLVLETGDLFGLHRRFRVATAPHFLLVYPKVVALEGYNVASRRPIGEVRLTHRLYEDPTRIAGVREYQTGDSLNRIHWRATARTGTLQSKVYEPSTVAGATLLVDFHRDSFEPQHEPYRSELAITAAASVASALYQMGQQVGLVTNGRDAVDRIRREGWDPDPQNRLTARQSAAMLDKSDRLQPIAVETCRGPEQLVRILETLARLELTDGLTLALAIDEAVSRMPRDATVLAIVTKVSLETAVALGELRRRGFAVTAVVNAYHVHEFEAACGPLMGEGIEARQLPDEAAIATMCEDYLMRGSVRA